MKLKDRVAIITGSGRGIGRAIAERFAREGAAILLNSRTEKELQQTADAIQQAGGRAAFVVGNVAEETTPEMLIATARKQWGQVDILVNNAGIYGSVKPLTELTAQEWDRILAVNLRSAFLLTRAVLPAMVERRRGVILNISSISGKYAFGLSGAYAASKAGLLALTRTAAAEVGRQGVRVNALCPGPIAGTRMWDELGPALSEKMGISREELEDVVLGSILQGRRQTPEEVAAAAVFLCSDDASAITGQAVNVDGGFVFY
ncbi:MAG: 3-oxoacyl-ACP reductase FabG [Acidobacteria bacterium]|nr:3-oxoacyl-ACP reductase FabG [Acidobacteriota bacterium]